MYLSDEEMREADPPIKYDNTMLSLYGGECNRKFYLFWRGLDYLVEPPYFTFGRAWDKGLAGWYVTPGGIEVRLMAAIKAAEKEWTDSGCVPDKTNNWENLKYLLMFYAIEYSSESWKVIAPRGQMELGFEFPLRDTGWYLTGAIDGYISWSPHGLLNLENKTSGVALNDRYLDQWSYSTQVTQYHWGLTKLLGEEPFGTLMNCAYKRLSQKAKDAFRQVGDIPEGIFARNLEKRSAFQLEEYERACMRIIEQIHTEWTRWEWHKTRWQFNCAGGIGKAPCPYRRLCLVDIEPWKMSNAQLLGSGLKWRTEEWEPWKRGGKEDENQDN